MGRFRNPGGSSGRSTRSLRPGVEGLGARQLLSGLPGAASARDVGVRREAARAEVDPTRELRVQYDWESPAAAAAESQATSGPTSGPDAGAGAGSTSAMPSGVGRVISDITYTTPDMPAEQLDLYLPSGTPPAGGWPVILAFAGGGWRWASRQQYGQQVAALTKYGFAVEGVDYAYASNTPDGSHSWPADLVDAQQAVRWTREHAGDLHLDPGEVVAMGDSAGGNLALMLGVYPSGPVLTDSPPSGPSAEPDPVSDKVDAVVSFYGPTDLTVLYDESRSEVLPYFDTYLGGPPSQYPGRYEAASPITYVNGSDPPILMVQGLEDRTDLPGQSYEMDAALAKAGVPHQLITISWADHGFGLDLANYPLTSDVANFLDAALKGGTIPNSIAYT